VLERFGLAYAADRRASTYSGGMRRRLDLAATLVGRPRVVFLDEPTTGLDPRSRAELWEMVRELRSEGTTILLTTQYLEEADQLAQLIAVIDQGRIVAEGTAGELKERVGRDRLIVRVADLERAGDPRSALSVLASDGSPEVLGAGELSLPMTAAGVPAEAVRSLDRIGVGVAGIEIRTSHARRRDLHAHRQARRAKATPARGGGRMNRPTPRLAVSDSLVMARRGLLETSRKPALLVLSFLQPVILVLIFRYAFGGSGRRPAATSTS
jgi:ABC-type glutathione transport system ATPase component